MAFPMIILVPVGSPHIQSVVYIIPCLLSAVPWSRKPLRYSASFFAAIRSATIYGTGSTPSAFSTVPPAVNT